MAKKKTIGLNNLSQTTEEILREVDKGYARKDGSYPDMTAGSAQNLLGNIDIVNDSAYRPVGGDNDVASGYEAASVQSIRGNAVAWNQLAPPLSAEYYKLYGVIDKTIEFSGDTATITINGSAPENETFKSYWQSIYLINRIPIVKEHIYITIWEVYSNIDCEFTQQLNGLSLSNIPVKANIWTKIINIEKNTTDSNANKLIAPSSRMEIGYSYKVRRPMLFDLTLIYGPGNEPTTPEQFEEDYQRWFGKPLTYEEYDEGSLRPVLASGIKTVGFNLWEHGDVKYASSSKYFYNECGYKGQFYITADFECSSSDVNPRFVIKYTDGTSTSTGMKYLTQGKIAYTTNANKVVSSINTLWSGISGATGLLSNICINFVWSGKRDGDYEPHWEETYSLPITSIKGKLNGEGESVVVFPDGLKRAGNVYDEIKVENGVTKAIKRIGSVDLGTKNWIAQSNNQFYSSGYYKSILGVIGLKVLCGKYPFYNTNLGEGIKMSGSLEHTPYIYIIDKNFEDASALKESLQGVIAYYPLETPQEYILDNFDLPLILRIDDFGTEQVLMPDNSITPVLVTRYGINAVDTIRRLPGKITEILNCLDTIKTKLDKYPDISEAQMKDGKTYGIKNGQFDDVCEDGYDVLIDPKVTATTLALQALETGEIPAGYEPEMYEEVQKLLGDEIFNEIAANSATTLELHPDLSDAEKIEQAKKAYLEAKAARLAEAETMEAERLDIEKGSLDVEHDKTK